MSVGPVCTKPKPEEDDGAIVFVGYNSAKDHSTLYVLDGQSMKELGRADMPGRFAANFHGRGARLTRTTALAFDPVCGRAAGRRNVRGRNALPWRPLFVDPNTHWHEGAFDCV